MRDYKFRCSSIGKLMTEPRSKAEGPLSQGARTYIRQCAAQEIFGVDFEVSSKEMEKGHECEQDSIDLFNAVYGRALVKNEERRTDDYFSGESDLPDVDEVVDIKTAWSVATFPISEDDLAAPQRMLYEWQLRAYMRLWNKPRASIAYCLVNTPERLIRNESLALHVVGHIPERMRVTRWGFDRDAEKEALMVEKVKHGRVYFTQVIEEFERSHSSGHRPPFDAAPSTPRVATPLPASIF